MLFGVIRLICWKISEIEVKWTYKCQKMLIYLQSWEIINFSVKIEHFVNFLFPRIQSWRRFGLNGIIKRLRFRFKGVLVHHFQLSPVHKWFSDSKGEFPPQISASNDSKLKFDRKWYSLRHSSSLKFLLLSLSGSVAKV